MQTGIPKTVRLAWVPNLASATVVKSAGPGAYKAYNVHNLPRTLSQCSSTVYRICSRNSAAWSPPCV